MPRFIYDRFADIATPPPGVGEFMHPSAGYNGRMVALAALAGRCATRFEYGCDQPIAGTTSIIGPNSFELTLIDDVHRRVNGDFATVRTEFGKLVAKILADPFGPTNIDHEKEEKVGQTTRLVHAVDGPLTELVPGKVLAIKGTGLDIPAARRFAGVGTHRLQLVDQFRATLPLVRLQQERAPAGIGGLLKVNEVYGVIRYLDEGRPREWMLMERAPGRPVQNIRLDLSGVGRPRNSDFAFSAGQHPELAQFVHPGIRPDGYVLFAQLRSRLNDALQLPASGFDAFGDLHGDNLFHHTTPDGPQYTVIDIDPR